MAQGFALSAGRHGDLWSGEKRSGAGGRALRASSSCSPQLFERSAKREASSAARPAREHRSEVCATRRPLQR